ncbi:phosphoribosylglycinamide synthetase [Sphingomonas oleivorans]|uniref:Phosphoribosylglycinamide synthetase n=1 Tax=Sphingomonas oleivorans TaxID=1735121 RepID=A0A2T5FUP7_9SPHN|nr:phosphoribosylglycinamide synthetase [Sphingomonas oleivorans]PTQ08248.1 phosphoribosylglycinamide synthetase [Sphingomonas oleivorans]
MSKPRHPNCAVIPACAKSKLHILFLAKHALSDGRPDTVDGNHALYHHELRTTLEQIGLRVTAANSFAAIEGQPDADFVIPLLNRAGFQNSEMLAPLLLTRQNMPFLGASPILRGFSDDKHLTKMAARHRGVPTMDWQIYRRGAGPIDQPHFAAGQLVVKPNASSASWGLSVVASWQEARHHIEALQAAGHDVIVEPYVPLIDIAVPVIGGAAREPWLLPPMAYMPDDPRRPRSYEEKRALIATADDPLVPVEDPWLMSRLERHTRALVQEFWPFDYGRFEYRYDPVSDDLQFMEVNLSCNLWSRKTISRSAATLGIDHATLVESIVAHSLQRQGLIAADVVELAA